MSAQKSLIVLSARVLQLVSALGSGGGGGGGGLGEGGGEGDGLVGSITTGWSLPATMRSVCPGTNCQSMNGSDRRRVVVPAAVAVAVSVVTLRRAWKAQCRYSVGTLMVVYSRPEPSSVST